MIQEPNGSDMPHEVVEDFSVEVFDGELWIPVSFRHQTIDDARRVRDGVRQRVGEDGKTRIIKWRETSEIVEADEKES